MRPRRAITLLLLLLALGAPALTATAGDGPLTITGTVIDENGRPVADYTLWAIPPRDAPREFRHRRHGTVTDANGSFRLERLIAGTYTLHGDESSTHARIARITAVAGGDAVTISTVAYRTIEGVVQDPAGKSLPGATVRVSAMPTAGVKETPTETPAREPLYRWTVADAKGRFELKRYPSLAPVKVSVTPPATHQDDLIPGVTDGIIPGAESLVIVAPAALTIAGRVVDEAGKPIAGALLEAGGSSHYLRDRQRRRIKRTAQTDADGRFVLKPYSPDERGYCTVRGPTEADPGWFGESLSKLRAGTADLKVVLKRGVAVAGRIEGVAAEQLRGLVVMAEDRQRRDHRFLFDGTTTAFRIQPVRPGPVKISFRTRNAPHLVTPKRVDLPAAKTDLAFQVARAHTLRGRVASRLEPHRLTVDYYDAWGEPHRYGKVAPDGTFELPNLPPGAGLLVITGSAGGRALMVDAADPAGEPLDLKLGSARRILGRIKDLPDKIQRARVTATRGPISVSAKVEEDGWFEILPLAPGRWTLTFHVAIPCGTVAPLAGVEAGDENVIVDFKPVASKEAK